MSKYLRNVDSYQPNSKVQLSGRANLYARRSMKPRRCLRDLPFADNFHKDGRREGNRRLLQENIQSAKMFKILLQNSFPLGVTVTSQEVAGSRPDEGNEYFCNLPNPSGRTRPWGLLIL
jgi:hypothetical protein